MEFLQSNIAVVAAVVVGTVSGAAFLLSRPSSTSTPATSNRAPAAQGDTSGSTVSAPAQPGRTSTQCLCGWPRPRSASRVASLSQLCAVCDFITCRLESQECLERIPGLLAPASLFVDVWVPWAAGEKEEEEKEEDEGQQGSSGRGGQE